MEAIPVAAVLRDRSIPAGLAKRGDKGKNGDTERTGAAYGEHGTAGSHGRRLLPFPASARSLVTGFLYPASVDPPTGCFFFAELLSSERYKSEGRSCSRVPTPKSKHHQRRHVQFQIFRGRQVRRGLACSCCHTCLYSLSVLSSFAVPRLPIG